jgi:hypothetical protein
MNIKQEQSQNNIDVHTFGVNLKFRLLKTKRASIPEYYIHVRLGDEQEMAYVGAEREFAISLYNEIVRGQVTPCTLHDVVEDARFETVCSDQVLCQTN